MKIEKLMINLYLLELDQKKIFFLIPFVYKIDKLVL